MKNNEDPITGSIYQGIKIRPGLHPYEGNKEVVELVFKGTYCNQVVVIDMETAKDLKKQLEFLL